MPLDTKEFDILDFDDRECKIIFSRNADKARICIMQFRVKGEIDWGVRHEYEIDDFFMNRTVVTSIKP